ncbi:MAG: LamB/YcsF family protein [Firmicutes bacterium]|nr:LamB/YcsF family protein [Bacillota bacterium]
MRTIDINSDLGEFSDDLHLENDRRVLQCVTSANIACGFHASDPFTMTKSVRMAKEAGAAIGAHPGFPDRENFGRRAMDMPPEEVKAIMLYQIGALQAICRAEGAALIHVKPHGALYNMAAKDEALADAIADAVGSADGSLILVGLSGSLMADAAKAKDLRFAAEVFADRAYEDDGSLVSRSKPGAMIEDENEAVRRMIRLIHEGVIESINGKDIPLQADTICVHGDGPKALAFASKLREALERDGIAVRNMIK